MRCIVVGLFLLLIFHGEAQTNNVNMGLNVFSGRMLKHTQKIHIPTPLSQQAVELSYRKQTQGNALWQQKFGYPETALNLLIAYNGRSELGYTIGLYPSIQFRLLDKKKFYLFGKLGGGIGLVTKYWQRTPASDSINNIIGGKINNVSMFQCGARYYVNNSLSVQLGLDFYHASNASARQPNYGINTYGLFLGGSFHPNGYQHAFVHQLDSIPSCPWRVGIKFCGAMAEDKIADGPMYPSYYITGFVQKRYRNKSHVLFGLDATYYEKLYALFKSNGLYVNQERQKAWRYSVYAGHEFMFGKIGFPLQVGVYLNRPIKGPIMYQKLGLNYHFWNHPEYLFKDAFLIAQLKTHLVQAEQAEFGIGFTF